MKKILITMILGILTTNAIANNNPSMIDFAVEATVQGCLEEEDTASKPEFCHCLGKEVKITLSKVIEKENMDMSQIVQLFDNETKMEKIGMQAAVACMKYAL